MGTQQMRFSERDVFKVCIVFNCFLRVCNACVCAVKENWVQLCCAVILYLFTDLYINIKHSPPWRLVPTSLSTAAAKSAFCRAPSYLSVFSATSSGRYSSDTHRLPKFSVAISWTVCSEDSTSCKFEKFLHEIKFKRN